MERPTWTEEGLEAKQVLGSRVGRLLFGGSVDSDRYNHIRAERGCPGIRGTKGGLATGTGGGTGSLREKLAKGPWPRFCFVT